jgi:hypothetical protein
MLGDDDDEVSPPTGRIGRQIAFSEVERVALYWSKSTILSLRQGPAASMASTYNYPRAHVAEPLHGGCLLYRLYSTERKQPPRVRKPSTRHDVTYAPTADLETHRAMLRTAFGTLSREYPPRRPGGGRNCEPG